MQMADMGEKRALESNDAGWGISAASVFAPGSRAHPVISVVHDGQGKQSGTRPTASLAGASTSAHWVGGAVAASCTTDASAPGEGNLGIYGEFREQRDSFEDRGRPKQEGSPAQWLDGALGACMRLRTPSPVLVYVPGSRAQTLIPDTMLEERCLLMSNSAASPHTDPPSKNMVLGMLAIPVGGLQKPDNDGSRGEGPGSQHKHADDG
mmetsp:Transcript_33496/g.97519  ORF Transcript_33496/g.97519 Transcript_33496/m.97519 type:complete len:208 (-) Transcript_33496:328-951(-)